MNNCCENAYQDGGTINQPQILDPTIVGGVLQSVTLTGGVKLDEATVTDLVSALCPALDECILNAVNGKELTDMILKTPQLIGQLEFDGDAAKSAAAALCSHLTDCITGAVKNNIIDGAHFTNMTIEKASLKGTAVLDADSAQSIADAIQDLLNKHILSVVVSGVIDAISLSNAKVSGLDLTGAVTLDETAAVDIVKAICPKLHDCIISAVKGEVLTGLTIDAPTISGKVKLDLDAAASIATALDSKISEMVNNALTNGTLCCLHIKGATIDNSDGKNNTWTDTTLYGDTNINGNLKLGADAIGDLCVSLQPCIDDRFTKLLNTRGRVTADQKTIVGKGTDEDPLRTNIVTDIDGRLLPAVTTQTELPTTIIGGRDQLLGKPDYYIRIGDHIIPAWKG